MLPSGSRLGTYEILGSIGAGGMGEVYRARDATLGRDVAIKILPESFAADTDRLMRFEREARTLASLNHPHIAQIYGFENGAQAPFHRALIMELVEGEDLAQRLARGAIPLDEAMPIARQIAEALEAAHERGIVHRDLKPGNVKLTPEGTVKVLDFGLAKLDARTQVPADTPGIGPVTVTSPAMTVHGVILGTAAYMAPEQAKGRAVDRRADVWAFGCVLFEMLTGRVAFAGETMTEVLANVIAREPAWEDLPADTPLPVRTLLRRCLDKDVTRRLQAIGEARVAIDTARTVPDDLAIPAPAPRRARTQQLAGWIGATLLGALLASAAIFVWGGREPGPTDRPPVARFDIGLPAGVAFSGARPMLALSDQGDMLAVVLTDRDGQPRLYMRRLRDDIAFQAITGTDGAEFPFWSPDGRHLAFFAAGKLKRIALAGGPPQTIADAPTGRGGAWNADDVIVFAPATEGVLVRIPAAGGTPVPVTRLAPGEAAHRFPSFLPDGTHFLYLAVEAGTRDASNGLRIGGLAGDASPDRQLDIKANSRAMYAVGHLVYAARGAGGIALVAQRFDPESLTLSGEPTSLIEQVDAGVPPGYAAFSIANTQVLAYTRGVTNAPAELVWHDRTGKGLGRVGAAGAYGAPSLSPDDTQVAVPISAGDDVHTWLVDVDRGVGTRLSPGGRDNQQSVWFPDGQALAVRGSGAGARTVGIMRRGLDGTEALWYDGAALPSSVAPDGTSIVMQMSRSNTGWDIFAVSNGTPPRPLVATAHTDVGGVVSPDGRWLAFASDESGRFEVYVQQFSDGRNKQRVSSDGGSRPIWRRDGRELFYVGADDRILAVPVGGSDALSLRPAVPLFPSALSPFTIPYPTDYAVSSDGQRLLLRERVATNGAVSVQVGFDWPGTR